jgi:hypothetical protein
LAKRLSGGVFHVFGVAVSVKTLANWHSAGVGPPAIKLRGGIIRYEEPAVMAWYAANRQAVA